MEVADCHVRSMVVWANALFVGTQPEGKIFVHNFTSGAEYLFVETEGHAVTSLVAFGGKLYAGTAPTGIVYSFDGTNWKEEYRPYGSGVVSMVAGSSLYVFSMGAEGPVSYDGLTWKTVPGAEADGQSCTVASANLVSHNLPYESSVSKSNEIVYGTSGLVPISQTKVIAEGINGESGADVAQATPQSPQFNVAAAVATASGLAFGGLDDGVVMSLSFSKLFDVGMPVTGLLYVSDKAMMAASGGALFLATPSTPLTTPTTGTKT